MTIQEVEKQGILIYKVIRGSHAYGTNLPSSDIDYSGIYIQSLDDIIGLKYREQVNDSKNDIVYYDTTIYSSGDNALRKKKNIDGGSSAFDSTKQKMEGKTQQERIDALIEYVRQSNWSRKPITVMDNMVIVFSKMYDLEPTRVASIFNEYQIIINTTPLGTFPNISEFPKLDYTLFTSKHIAFDLVYNPEESAFLKKARKAGAITKNGQEMLINQAEKAWLIWNK
jgi:hypothetical protein